MDRPADERGIRTKIIGAATVAMLTGAIAFQVGQVTAPPTTIHSCVEGVADCVDFGGVEAVSHAVFVGAAVPFELVSMLLLGAVEQTTQSIPAVVGMSHQGEFEFDEGR